MVTKQMQKSEVMNRNASLSSELCAKSSKGTVCNEVFRLLEIQLLVIIRILDNVETVRLPAKEIKRRSAEKRLI